MKLRWQATLIAACFNTAAVGQPLWDATSCGHLQEMVSETRSKNWGVAHDAVLLSQLDFLYRYCDTGVASEIKMLVDRITRQEASRVQSKPPTLCQTQGDGMGNSTVTCY